MVETSKSSTKSNPPHSLIPMAMALETRLEFFPSWITSIPSASMPSGSPIFKSLQSDMGYDISDYRTIHEPYGTVEHVEQLIKGLRERGIKNLLDLVVNHSSD
jgi:hypothetical protein